MQPDSLKKPNFLRRFKTWAQAHPARAYAIGAVGLLIAGSLTTAAVLWQKPVQKETSVTKTKKVAEKPKTIYYSPLTGEPVADQSSTTKAATAIMLENSPDARPQSGLKDAEIVYEAVAEGGITRFLALYQQRQPEVIGPVRSIRMYYVDWLTPYNASVAHIGGSAAALQLVRNGGYRDIDQFFNASYYRRASDRAAPHNVYTSFSKLNELNSAKGYVSSEPKPFDRADDEKDPVQDATRIDLKISGPTYNPSYDYDAASKMYLRSQAGAPHLDREAGQIQAKVVVAMRVNMTRVMEDGYRESITTTGSGEAIVFQNGHANTVTWHKDSREAQLRFTDSAGAPFKLARGTTWISAVPTSNGNVSWQ
jgi:hypothetical protein